MSELYAYVVTENPSDYPGLFVVRRHRIESGQTVPEKEPWMVSASLQSIRERLQAYGLYCIERDDTDDPVIVETWM